jgi:hypothetical protein
MKKLIVAAVAALAAVASTAYAQDKGGKVRWERNPQAAMERAKAEGKGMMLYFTSAG